MSARLAWNRPWFRVLSLGLLTCVTSAVLLYLLNMQSIIREASTIVFHSNVYVGIDDVRSWPWMFVWPSIWWVSVVGGVLAAYGAYQRDSLLAYSLLIWFFVWSCPWVIGFYYLFLFTLR